MIFTCRFTDTTQQKLAAEEPRSIVSGTILYFAPWLILSCGVDANMDEGWTVMMDEVTCKQRHSNVRSVPMMTLSKNRHRDDLRRISEIRGFERRLSRRGIGSTLRNAYERSYCYMQYATHYSYCYSITTSLLLPKLLPIALSLLPQLLLYYYTTIVASTAAAAAADRLLLLP